MGVHVTVIRLYTLFLKLLLLSTIVALLRRRDHRICFIELNLTERINFPVGQIRQEMPIAENSSSRVVEHHGMIRTLSTLICLKGREEGKLKN